MDYKRVVITGMSCITPVGTGTEELWNGMLTYGKTAAGPITHFDTTDYTTPHRGGS